LIFIVEILSIIEHIFKRIVLVIIIF